MKQNRDWRLRDPAARMFYDARARAKKAGLPFDVEKTDIILPTHCPILGVELNYKMGNKGRPWPNSPSLDKLVPSKGYVKGNVFVISWRANAIKHDASLAEIEAVARYIRERL